MSFINIENYNRGELYNHIMTMNFGKLLNLRDDYCINSFQWQLIDYVKSIRLESERPSMVEILRVIPSFYLKKYTGFIPNKSEEFNYIKGITKNKAIPLRRSVAEFNPKYRQLIASALIVDVKGNICLMCKDKANDTRLLNTYGFPGGHVSIDDKNTVKGLKRELHEEVEGISDDAKIESMGYINTYTYDTSSVVSNEHICALYRVTVEDCTKLKAISYKEHLKVFTLDELKSSNVNIDSWVELSLAYI